MHLFNGEFFRLLLALVGWVMATLMVELDWNHHHNCNYQMPGFKITRGHHRVKMAHHNLQISIVALNTEPNTVFQCQVEGLIL